eukprot:10343549-Lingulodinium_polyedra.AAC.1
MLRARSGRALLERICDTGQRDSGGVVRRFASGSLGPGPRPRPTRGGVYPGAPRILPACWPVCPSFGSFLMGSVRIWRPGVERIASSANPTGWNWGLRCSGGQSPYERLLFAGVV